MGDPVPDPAREPTGRWEVIRYAIDDKWRTIRLIAILISTTVPPGVITWLAVRR
jgi:hypothetical protein